MIEIELEGFSGKASSLITSEVTATGTIVRLHGPLAEAINKLIEDEYNLGVRSQR